ncbi:MULTISPECIES: flagellar hook-associated protein FlgK [unclassified Oceanispirochaeta]|uniref:flagellar hook-associated protein FlgK n=1 Tax=unclassified Oceanispirochaeta TaxID=2635722 RepID=UPI000E09D509|nr:MULTISPECIES: flagellar hook-associated protein FlgK [unclassified Oceanispirochaeta]MBF9014819.1 flagellar hook-associated protein FlgK [Oceanispirochaeta sp. M2]NPD71075.1 flagellar hook-associated protein FlgK [Oceanispirochaeta sp. M1]RDG33908.1 flagellar hook-associated protein FlgK [Oceanispirochaeta sp. M1]
MGSTFSGIELGKRSLQAHTQGLQTIGHNLSNASTEGYSRQRVRLSATDPIYMPQLNRAERPGQIGQGVDVTMVERIKDTLLENRIIAQGDETGYWDTRDQYLLMVEQIYNEPYDTSVRSLMDNYWDSWQELSVHPEDMPARQAVLKRGESLIDGINGRYRRLKETRTMLNDDVAVSVGQVNSILTDISRLNLQIEKSEAVGDNPNDLLDSRDLLVEKLSGFINVTVDNRDPDEFLIHTQGMHLIQGKQVHLLDTQPNPLNEGYLDVKWADTGRDVDIRNGKLAALLELRDGDVRGEIQKLDMMTVNFTDMVNEVHSEAFSANGSTGIDFFTEYPFVNNALGNYDRSGDGEFDSSYIFRMTGNNALNSEQQTGLEGTITLNGAAGDISVEYFPTDRIADIVDRINNAGAEVKALINREGRLVLKGSAADDLENPDFVIRHVEDSGSFLAGYAGLLGGSGAENAYNWDQADAVLGLRDIDFAVAPLTHPAGWMGINEALQADPASIASGFGLNGREGLPGDGSAALEIASLRNKSVMVGPSTTFDDYFADVVASIGLKGEAAQQANESQQLVMKDLKDFQSSISGVNMDEEFAEMIKFQHGYNAAARFVSNINDMLDTIINRMGV